MKVEELISSGILEAYVLGNASAEEIQLIQEMEKLHPEITDEIELIEASLIEYSEMQTGTSSVELKNKIWKKINSEKNKTERKVVQLIPEKKNSDWMKLAVAASIALLIGSFIFIYNTNKKLSKTEQELAMIMDPSTKMVSLKGMEMAPTASAKVMWSTKDKSVYVHVASLPMPPAGMQYQLWAIVNGKPVDGGVFEYNLTALHTMKSFEEAQAFAITLEPEGGSKSPTLDKMYVLGTL